MPMYVKTPSSLGGGEPRATTPLMFYPQNAEDIDMHRFNLKVIEKGESIKVSRTFIFDVGVFTPQIEDDHLITDTDHYLLLNKVYEEIRHKMAIRWGNSLIINFIVEKGAYDNTLEPKIQKRETLIKNSKYPYKHLLYKE